MSAPQPAKSRPAPTVIEGHYARLEPAGEGHVRDLFRAASPERYRWLVDHPPPSEAETAAWVARATAG